MRVFWDDLYISSGCNKSPHVLDANERNVCMATGNEIAILNHEANKIENTLHYHQSRVTCIRWVKRFDSNIPTDWFISTSVDKTAVLWSPDFKINRIFKGHEDAVNAGDGMLGEEGMLVATASADLTVRIWKEEFFLICAMDFGYVDIYGTREGEFYLHYTVSGHEDWVRALDITTLNIHELYLASGSQDTSIRIYKFKRREGDMELMLHGSVKITLETVLNGHENWIYSVCWREKPTLQLLSSSMDKSIIIWQPDETGLWTEVARFGMVGGNILGFYGAKFIPNSELLVGHDFQGALHLWKPKDGQWEAGMAAGGHNGEVCDVSWSPKGDYVISVSADQTARIHGPHQIGWHEIARPQVHGHDMTCVATLTNVDYVSGADEKVLRVFSAPRNFLKHFSGSSEVVSETETAEGATVPSLGLSNKPMFKKSPEGGGSVDESNIEYKPPVEEDLLQNTLWPEVQKLYGHGYEIYCVAARPDGAVIASACKASNVEHASVILWSTSTWQQIQKLSYHQLTVTQIAFSPDNRYLLTVSRDRKWCLYQAEATEENPLNYEILFKCENSPHSRLIWCCSWSHDSKKFATGSRDGKICIWDLTDLDRQAFMADVSQSVTSLAFGPEVASKREILLAGTESGMVVVFTLNNKQFVEITRRQLHGSTVRRLHFNPSDQFQFASCSNDHSVKVITITVDRF